MARETNITLRNKIIYSVYVRCHTEEGTFRAVEKDLDRIRSLGTDIIWFMPIHPIGIKGKKGSLGCPYANRDYRTVNPFYGTEADFAALVQAIHARGMQVMIDVVYNHTSPDATLVTEHPEFYYKKPDGSFGGRTAEWSDVIDLDYRNRGLWDYQIESLRQWAALVDGFRCDVASLVPVDFWCAARQAVKEVNPDCLWLAESIHLKNVLDYRRAGVSAAGDAELFTAFDMEYDYDIRDVFEAYLAGKLPLSRYLTALNLQEGIYPENYIKMRCLENHDRPRIASLRTGKALENLTALLYFLKGSTLLYAGQEFACTHTPSLFEKEPFPRDTGTDFTGYLTRLAAVKKEVLEPDDSFFASADNGNEIAVCLRENARSGKTKLGVFCLAGAGAGVAVPVPDGFYENALGGSVTVSSGTLYTGGMPVILSFSGKAR